MSSIVHVSSSTVELEDTSPNSAQRVLYRSEDGHVLAGIFAESGSATITYSYTEFLVVIAGRATYRIDGGEEFVLETGDCAVMPEGVTVQFQMSDDFRDACCMVGTAPIPY